MFNLQEQILEIAGPLTCLWSHLLNSEEELDIEAGDPEGISTSGERITLHILGTKKDCLGQINPELKLLALEDYKDKLFGPGFLEKASKKLETDKALAKVAAPLLHPKK